MAKNDKWIALGAIAIAAVAGVTLFGNPFQSSVPGMGAGTTSTSGAGMCPSSGKANINLKAVYTDLTTNGVETAVNTTDAVYYVNDDSLAFTKTSSTSGYSLIGSVNCGQAIVSYVGDGGATYYFQKIDTPGIDTNKAEVNIVANLKKSGAATLTFVNTQTNQIGAAINISGVGSGATNQDVTLRLKAGQYYYGDGARELCAQWEISNFTKVSFGADAVMIPNDPSIGITTGYQMGCYEVKGDLFNFAQKELPVIIQAKAGVVPAASAIKIYANDMSAYVKNGKLVTGYVNADTNADLGLAVVSATSAITVNP